ncbi:hypothetical protein GR702_11515 [Novosphingobium sp. FGD1]|uniref:Uncharacterized protein n=1 Tax=Novosphingobium silvae TaxID=2692619 RepID=A0A7X4K6U9_9SPHN|nr:hypothetical protein [Novosphingobium silvae]MYL98391.1 hypothetical protein [Novosphingobium silvae]
MSVEFKEALEREIAELESSLQSDPRFVKLQELQRLSQLYSPLAETMSGLKMMGVGLSVIGVSKPARSFGGGEAIVDGNRRMTSVARQKVLEDAENILRGRTEPTRTSDLYDALIAAGNDIGGDDPKNNLSAMLSKSPLFRSHKRAGWTLVATNTTVPDDDEEFDGRLEPQGPLEGHLPAKAMDVFGPRGKEYDL